MDPTPSPTPQPPAENRLRWVASPGGTSLDGNLLEAGTDIWLQERYPDKPPVAFDVLPVVDPALAPSLEEIEPVADFDAIAADFVAHSDAQWKLPVPPPSSGTISYRFRDDANRMSRSVSVGTLAALALQLESPGPGKPPQALVAIDDEFRIDVDARFLDGADVGVELLAPWGESDETLLDFVRAYYLDVTHDPAAANAAAEKFIAENGDVLPGERPANWGFSMEPGAFSGQAGGQESFALTGSLGSAGVTYLAIKLVDQADPSRVAVSRIFRLEAAGPDEPPTVEVVEPGSFGDAEGTTYDLDSDGTSLFKKLQLTARVDDPDGPIPDESIIWTTDRGDLQPNEDPVLGTGEFLITTLYAEDCPGTDHVVTLTVDDGDGHVVASPGTMHLVCQD